MSCARGAHARSATSGWRSWCARRWRRNQKAVRIGVSAIAAETRVSKSTVHRIWQAFGLEPHRQKHFKLSTDPFFVEKVRDIVGLYLNPPENAVVLCVDEKSQFKRWNAPSRCCRWDLAIRGSDPRLPTARDHHAICRTGHGEGKVLTQCDSVTDIRIFGFLREIEKNVPETLEVHIIVDNYARTTSTSETLVRRTTRFHVHFTPTMPRG